MGEPSSKARIELRVASYQIAGALSLQIVIDRQDCRVEQAGAVLKFEDMRATSVLVPGEWLSFKMSDAFAKLLYYGGTRLEIQESINCTIAFQDVRVSDGKRWIQIGA